MESSQQGNGGIAMGKGTHGSQSAMSSAERQASVDNFLEREDLAESTVSALTGVSFDDDLPTDSRSLPAGQAVSTGNILQALEASPGAAEGFRVRLADIRDRLSGFTKEEVTESLKRVASDRRTAFSLLAAEDLSEIKPRDRAAAVDFGDGDLRFFAVRF